MNRLTAGQVTRLLQDWHAGEQAALEDLLPLIYEELHRLAHAYMRREAPGRQLQTTALIHEAYLRIPELEGIEWEDSSHFYGIVSRLMRQILVDAARARKRLKRGGAIRKVRLTDQPIGFDDADERILALHELLEQLFESHERQARVVELRYFGGFSVEETASALDVSEATVARDWRFARAWLRKRLRKEVGP